MTCLPDANAIVDYVRAHPGASCRDVALAFGISPAHMGVEMRRLRAEGVLAHADKSKKTRGTRYVVAQKEGSEP